MTTQSTNFAFGNVAAATTDGALTLGDGSGALAAVAGKKIRVVAVFALAGGTATTLTFNSKGSGAGTAASAAFACGANGGFVLPYNPLGWFETNASENLTVTTGAGSTTGLQVVYGLIPG